MRLHPSARKFLDIEQYLLLSKNIFEMARKENLLKSFSPPISWKISRFQRFERMHFSFSADLEKKKAEKKCLASNPLDTYWFPYLICFLYLCCFVWKKTALKSSRNNVEFVEKKNIERSKVFYRVKWLGMLIVRWRIVCSGAININNLSKDWEKYLWFLYLQFLS